MTPLSFSVSELSISNGVGLGVFPIPEPVTGTPPFTYELLSGTGTLNPTTGQYISASIFGTASIRVTDANSSSVVLTLKNSDVFLGGSVYSAVEVETSPGVFDYYIGGDLKSYKPYGVGPLMNISKTDGEPSNSLCNWGKRFSADAAINDVVTTDDAIYVGGTFSVFDSHPVQNLVKIVKKTCELDQTFTQSTGAVGAVNTLAIGNSALYVGGSITSYRGVSVPRLMKVDLSNGDLDAVFTQAVGPNQVVNAIIYTNSAVYVGGNFTSYRGTAVQRLIKIDPDTGAIDGAFTTTSGFSAAVNSLAVGQSSLYVGGSFTNYRGQSASGLAKLDLNDGTLDSAFSSGGGINNGAPVLKLIYTNASIYAAGRFGNYRSTTVANLIKVNPNDGSLDTTFSQTTGLDAVYFNIYLGGGFALAADSSSLYVGGLFDLYRGVKVENLIKVDLNTGNLDTTFSKNLGPSEVVKSVLLEANQLWIGGSFSTYRGTPIPNLIKIIGSTGELDATFSQVPGPSRAVTGLLHFDSALYAVGVFEMYRGTPVGHIAKLNLATGALDGSFIQGTGFNSSVDKIATDGTSIYVMGQYFTDYNGGTARKLAKLSKTGTLDVIFSPNNELEKFSGADLLYSLYVSGGSLYVGGTLSSYNSTPVKNIVKLSTTDKSLDPTFLRLTGLNGSVQSIVKSGSSLYLGGEFTQYSGAGAYGLAKVHSDTGVLDGTFTQSSAGFDSYVASIHVIGSSLYVGGGFKNYRGVPAAGLAKLDLNDGTLDTNFTQATGFNGMIQTIANSVDQLLVFGRYTSYRGNPSYRTNWLHLTTGDAIK